MGRIKVKHLGDNYFEVAYALSPVIDIHKIINAENETIAKNIIKDEVYDEDPEINNMIENQLLSYTENNVAMKTSYSYILLLCSGIEEAIRLLQKDGLNTKDKKENIGDYLYRTKIVPTMTKDIIQDFNDIFILRHWIIHRNGRSNLQKLSKEEKELLQRAGRSNIQYSTYLFIEYEYINKIALRLNNYLQAAAKAKYE